MSSKYRHLWASLSRLKAFYKDFPTLTYTIPKRKITLRCVFGFSIFTWLGLEKKLTAEDELIESIKHCVLFIQRNEYDKAEQLLHVVLRQAQQTQNQLGITYIYDVMANLAFQQEHLDKAKRLFVAVTQRIIADGAKEDDLRVVHISAKLARISHLQKEYRTAQIGYDWCLNKLREKMAQQPTEDMKKLLAMTEDWYGRLFLDCEEHDKGINMLLSALNHMKEVSDIEQEHIVVQLNDIGTVCDRLGRTDDSIYYFNEAITLGKQIPEMDDLGAMYVNLGRAYIKKNLLDEARKSCGHGWKLGYHAKNNTVKSEAELCIKEIKSKG